MADEPKFTQADIDAAIEKAVGPLKSKLDEVMDEAKEAKRKLRSASEIKPEDLTAAEERADKAEAALKAAEGQVKTLTTERDKAAKALEAEQGFTSKLLIQDGLKSALLANGVKDEDYIDALATKFATGATIVSDGDARKGMIGDKPVADYIKEWAGSDVGKKFVSAPINSGGGAPGGSGGGRSKSISEADFAALPAKERAARMADGYTVGQPA